MKELIRILEEIKNEAWLAQLALKGGMPSAAFEHAQKLQELAKELVIEDKSK